MIKLPTGHPENLDGDHTFLEWTQNARLQQPPQETRDLAGRRIEACIRQLSDAVELYRKAVEADAGVENADSRVSMNVRNVVRNYSNLAEIFIRRP